jgi:ADP-ribose pyrophosphatase YjhB (NUDIX family)
MPCGYRCVDGGATSTDLDAALERLDNLREPESDALLASHAPKRAGNPAGRDSTTSRDVPRVVTGAVDSWGVWNIDLAKWANRLPMSEESARRTAEAWAHLETRFEARRQSTEITRRAFSVSVYLQSARTVLLIKHKRLNAWLPIGGERRGDETPLETAKRKVREETGWDPEALIWSESRNTLGQGAPYGFLGYEEHPAGNRGLHMNFVFKAFVPNFLHDQPPRSDGSWSDFVWHTNVPPIEEPTNVAEVLRLLLSSEAT